MKILSKALCAASLLFLLSPLAVQAQLTGQQNIIVLRVYFHDVTNSTRFTAAQIQGYYNNLNQVWGSDTSYGTISLSFQISSLYQVPGNTATYLDSESETFSTATGFSQLVSDAVANAPSGLNWSGIHSLMILFADTRTGGFYRGITFQGVSISPPTGSTSLPVSVVGEDPAEDVTYAWGRWGHEIGHELQIAGPPHPSNYNSFFEIMDREYPAQSGVFEKESNMGFPGWMPPSKYKIANPPAGVEAAVYAEENPPSGQPDFQGIKAFLTFGSPSVYYLISVRRRTLGDDINTDSPLVSPTDCDATQTPNGIPDCGVLIERVVEGGDPSINDCPLPQVCNRWVDVMPNNGNVQQLWHQGDIYRSAADGIEIIVREKKDNDHYVVAVTYNGDIAGQPDVGLNSWLEPPGNTYETTDIWIDSPLNGYDIYRYGTWPDLMGGTVPTGNGDNPAVGQVNRLYARVRNYGSAPAANVTVFFDITNPPGVGINGSNGFINLGQVTSAQFPGLALINPGQHVDVYYEWTPNFPLTPAQIAAGQFFFHTCVRVRLSHVAGETFFANQDGDGQQENIQYFDATGAGGAPGAPGPANRSMIKVRNDAKVRTQYYLGVLRETLPKGWKVVVNEGHPVITLDPSELREVPVEVKQEVTESIGAHYSFRVIAQSIVTFRRPRTEKNERDLHSEARILSGVQIPVYVVRKTKIECKAKGSEVEGKITGLDEKLDQKLDQKSGQKEVPPRVYVVGVNADGRFEREGGTYAEIRPNGSFVTKLDWPGSVKRGVCLFAGTQTSSSAGSQFFSVSKTGSATVAPPKSTTATPY